MATLATINSRIGHHLSLQCGVISRRQALEAGLRPHDLRRLVRRREWVAVHPGVYVSHTGSLTWVQRPWAAVLLTWPSALCGESALRAADGAGSRERISEDVIHLGAERASRSPPASGCITWPGSTTRCCGTSDHGSLAKRPRSTSRPGAESEMAAIAALAKACQSRRTTAARLLVTLADRPRISRRRWLEATLRDVAEGTSVLEHGFLTRIERAHRLPRALRQARATASVAVVHRDVEYDEGFVVELGGRLFHDSATQRDADFERDLDAAVDGKPTVRLSWGQVFDRPCTTTAKLVVVLRAHGVVVIPRGCAPGCPVGVLGLAA